MTENKHFNADKARRSGADEQHYELENIELTVDEPDLSSLPDCDDWGEHLLSLHTSSGAETTYREASAGIGAEVTLACGTGIVLPREQPATSMAIQGDFAAMIDQARKATSESRAEYINRLVLEDFAPDPRTKTSEAFANLVQIAVALAPIHWSFGVFALPPRKSGDATIYLSKLSSDVLAFESIHAPTALFRFADDLRKLSKSGGGAVLTPLGAGESGKGAVYVAKRIRRTIEITVTMTVDGKPHSTSKTTVSSRDIEKTARFFEYVAVITERAGKEYPEGF